MTDYDCQFPACYCTHKTFETGSHEQSHSSDLSSIQKYLKKHYHFKNIYKKVLKDNRTFYKVVKMSQNVF